MGFSSFGAKPNPPKKKRRLVDPNGPGSGSGTNNTPLGVLRTAKVSGAEGGEDQEQGSRQPFVEMGGVRGQELWYGRSGSQGGGTASTGGLPAPDPLAAADALDGSAGLLPETGLLLPRYLDGGVGFAEGGVRGYGKGQEGGRVSGGGGDDGLRRQGKRGDGEWDWQALRRGVLDERGDVAFYDGSFVEDSWRGLEGERGGGR